MGVSRSDGNPRAHVADVPLCSHSRDVEAKGKTPNLDKEVWGTEGLIAGGSCKGHQQKEKKDKMQQNQKVNRDGKCLKLVKKGLSLNLNIPLDSSLK